MKKILVVVDMQNDFIHGVLGTKEAEEIMDNAVSKIAGFDGRIFATLDTHDEDYLNTMEGRKLPRPHCLKRTDGWLLHEKILKALSGKDYKTIEKQTFGSTALIDEIRNIKKREEITIEVIGLCTDICVISNVLLLKAYFPETSICVDSGCCAGVTPQTHRAALDTMKMCQIDVV